MSLPRKHPIEWKQKTFSNALSVLKDGTHFSPKAFGGKNFYITSKNIRMGKLDLEDVSYIPDDEHHRIYSSSPVRYGDVLLTKDGAKTGNVCINTLKVEFSLLSSVAYLRGKTDLLLNEFLLQWLSSPRVQYDIKNEMAGQAITRLTLQKIGKFKILLPTLPEQKAIADLLSTWDEAIEKTERLIQAKEKRFKWLLRELISGPRNTQKSTEWKRVKIGSFLTESRIPDRENDPKKRLSVRLHLKGVEVREYRGTESDGATAYFVRKAGQFIYGKQNVFRGSVGIVPPELDGYSSTQDIPAFDVTDGVNKSWLLFLFSYPNFYKKLELYASGSGSKRLHPKELFKMKIALPSFEEQQEIAEALTASQQGIDLLKQLADKYKTQKRGLMQKMLTGEWRVRGFAE